MGGKKLSNRFPKKKSAPSPEFPVSFSETCQRVVLTCVDGLHGSTQNTDTTPAGPKKLGILSAGIVKDGMPGKPSVPVF